MNTAVQETSGGFVGSLAPNGSFVAAPAAWPGGPVQSGLPLSSLYVRQLSRDRNINDITLENQTELTAKFNTGSIGHTLLAGVDLNYESYTNKPLSWHTDGYYNLPEEQIYGMLLHCAQPALEGGESWLMDHEIAYILLRDTNPDYIHALMHPNAFTIPANILNGEIIRPEQSGPVFSVTAAGHLHMRYSARQRNVIWRDDPMTREAADFLLNLWQQDSPYKIRYTLQAGEGLLCNNVLHNRTAFKDSDDPTQTRLLYRGRYFDRVEESKETICSV